MKHRLITALASLLWATSPVLGYAATPSDLATAEALFQDAKRLMSEGQYKSACPKLAESQRIDPAVGTLLYLAECYEKCGQTASAWATFELAAAEGRKDRQTEREMLARQRAEQLLPKLSRLTITVADNAKITGLEIRSDGMLVGAPSWGTALPVDPGKHVIMASAPGKKDWVSEVDIAQDTAITQIPIPILEDAVVMPTTSPVAESQAVPTKQPEVPVSQAPEPASEDYWNTQRIIGLGVAGAGVVGIGVGTVLAVSAHGKQSDSEKYCAPNDSSRCTQQGVDLIDSAHSQNTAGSILLGLGGALLVGGGVVFFTAPTSSESRVNPSSARHLMLVPQVAHNAGGVLLSGKF